MPIKSITLQKLEEMEQKARELGRVEIHEAAANAAGANESALKRDTEQKDDQNTRPGGQDAAPSKSDVWRADD